MKPTDQNSRPRCVLILGMHRSGTSALTRCLNLLGVDLGSHLLSPKEANAKGFWEHADAVRINDDLLQYFGMHWHDLAPLPENWLDSEGAAKARNEIRALIGRDFQGVPLWGLKDPRICRLAPLWVQTLREMEIDVSAVFVVRSPLEVAASLQRAHGLNISSSVISWLQHLVESEVATRDVMRTMVDYDRLLQTPSELLGGIGRAIDLEWPIPLETRQGAIHAFLDADLRTHHKRLSDGELPPLVHRALQACHRIVMVGGRSEWADLSHVADESLDMLRMLAYQRSATDQVVVPKASGFQAGLYYAAKDEPFSEARVVRLPPSAGRGYYEFPLPDVNPAMTRFRLDPLEGGGCIVLRSFVVLDSDKKVIWDSHESHIVSDDLQAIDSLERPGQKLLLATHDPQLFFSLDAVRLSSLKGCVLTVDIDYRSTAEVVAELQASRAWQLEQHEKWLDKLEAVKARQADELRSIKAAHADDLSSLQMRMDESIAEYRQMLKARDQELEKIYASTLWLALAPIRGLVQRMPVSTRAKLRRALKAVWWGITPWRLPERLRRRKSNMLLVARPAQHLRSRPSSFQAQPTVWEVDGADPFFYVTQQSGAPAIWAGGWYLLDMELRQQSGVLNAPKLYLNYGRNFNEVWSFSLSHLQTPDGISGLIRFEHDVSGIRFDPSDKACEFVLGNISLRRVSKFRAGRILYKNLVARNERPLVLIRGGLAQLRRGGFRQAGNWLYNRFIRQGEAEIRNYEDWIKKYDVVSAEDLQLARMDSMAMVLQPLISIVMPVFNTPPRLLRRCIDSVLAQAYPHWELCIADDASSRPHIRKLLQEYSAKDSRIKVTYREINGHISEASNSALALASGDWVALLDHDDELPPHALYIVAKAINERPDAALFYSDEDKIDEEGHRYDPYFKPDWNPDLFYGQNTISHLGVYKTGLIREIGGFRKGLEGSQDYDLALRCVENVGADQVVHIPRVLYHWRAVPGSTALGGHEKSYAALAGKKALEEHFSRIGKDVEVQILSGGYRVKYARSEAARPKVSLIIPTRDRVELLRMCVESILARTKYSNYEIVIVDNQSQEPETHAYFRRLSNNPKMKIVTYDAPFNYSTINNTAVAASDGEFIGLVNNDIEVISPDWLDEMVSHARREDIGAVGAMLYYPNNTIQHAGVVLGVGGVAGHVHAGKPRGFSGQMSRATLVQNLSAVTAACLLVRRETFDAVGGLDPRLEVAFNDVDFCLRVRELGLRNLWTPFAELYHHESASRGYEDTPEKQQRFLREVALMIDRWGKALKRDPAYNPNLTLERYDFSLSSAPRISSLKDIALNHASVF